MSHRVSLAIKVEIKDDPKLAAAFARWALDNEILSLWGTSWGGMGGWGGDFETRHRDAINEFFDKYRLTLPEDED